MANTYIKGRSPKGTVGVDGVVDSGELSSYTAGVLSGFGGKSVSSWTIQVGGQTGVQDTAVAKNPSGESELFAGTPGQSIGFTLPGAPGTPGQSQVHALVIYKDPFTVSLVNNAVDVIDYQVVSGTSATTGSQVAPNDATIRSAIPSGSLKFVTVVGYVTIAYGAGSVSLGNLSRRLAGSLATPAVVANITERNYLPLVAGMKCFQVDIDSVLTYNGSRWKWAESPHRLGTDLGADVTMANAWTTYATVTATSLGGTVEASTETNVGNASSGAYRSFDLRVQCDGVTIGTAITALGAIYIAGVTPLVGYANTFSSIPAAGSHTWTFQMQASAAASVNIKAPRITINEL